MGRPHHGERVLLGTRVPPELAEIVRSAASDEGLTVNDYLALMAARQHGFAIRDPRDRMNGQEELPLTG